jgi:predicted amidohydrolase YtcJ
VLIRGAEIEGRWPLDVRIAGERIAEVGSRLARAPGEAAFEANGGVLLPGLCDHHVHLHALAAAQRSIACGPPAVATREQLGAALRAAAASGSGWLRGVAYHESVAGELDRKGLDAWVRDRPLRVQHRSGALWIVNSAGLAELGVSDSDGRLFRADAWLRAHLRDEPPDLAAVGARLASYGVTELTDASADTDGGALAHLCAAAESGALPQRVLAMGTAELPAPEDSSRVARGAVKALLDEPQLPDFTAFCERIRAAHAQGRGFAVHCVTRAQGIFAAAALRDAGARRGDRIEHASVAPPELVALVAELPVAVITQPHFLAERGDDYARDVAREDRPYLYRARGWLDACVPLASGSDAPYGSPDPWRAMAAAVARKSAAGVRLAPEEALSPEQALALYLSGSDDPGGRARRVAAGAPADLCLLDRPWSAARARLASQDVRATWCAGRMVWHRDGEPR